MSSAASSTDVLIIGAGLAGLAAAVALSGAGVPVTLLDRKPYVGGRAYSYHHPALREEIDSQHVLMGCCTNLIDLCSLAGAEGKIRWYDDITFLEPASGSQGVRRSVVGPGGLPAPPQATWNFLRAPMLGLRDKLGIVRGVTEFLRGYPLQDDESVAAWLKRTAQTDTAIRHFWEPIVLATLNDSFERSSARYLGKVIHETLIRNTDGGRFGIPTEPLSTFYAAFARLAERSGAKLRLRTSVDSLGATADGRWRAKLADGEVLEAGKVLLASPFEATRGMLQSLPRTAGVDAVLKDLASFSHAPITTIHLWFDRVVTDLPHAALLDTRIQWMFNKSLIRNPAPESDDVQRQYLELTISGSFPELKLSREEILQPSLEELTRFFPKVREANLLKSGVLKEARATFSVLPGMDRMRPASDALQNGIYLAGDWTRTDWPSTMEGAARSGRLAAEAILRSLGDTRSVVTPDLPPAGLLRLFL